MMVNTALDDAMKHWQSAWAEMTDASEYFERLARQCGNNPNGGDAQGLKAWAYNHWNKTHASFEELGKASGAVQYGMGLIRAELGHNTKTQADVTVHAPNVTGAYENKSITTSTPGDVDSAIRDAMIQLAKRTHDSSGFTINSWRAVIGITDQNNPWPYTPTDAVPQDVSAFDLGDRARRRNLGLGNGKRLVTIDVKSARWGSFQFFGSLP